MARWPLRTARFWEEAPFFRLLLPLCAAIVLYDAGFSLPGPFLLVLLPACLGAVLVLFSRRPVIGSFRAAGALLLMFTVFLLGLGLCRLNDARTADDWMGHQVGRAPAFWLRLEEEPEEKERTWKLPVQVFAAHLPQGVTESSGKALVYVYKNDSICRYHRGDTLLLQAQWQPVRNAGNPFSFDAETWYRRNNVFFQAFVPQDSLLLIAEGRDQDKSWLLRRREAALSVIKTYFPDAPYQGLMKALLLNEDDGFDPELRQAYTDTGVIHIVAISGSHIATLFLLVGGLLFWIRGRRWKWVRYVIGLAVVWSYILLAGAPPSALRSGIMFSFIAAASVLGREQHALNTLLAAAFILLLGRPMWLFSVGFQLSFVAVLALVTIYPSIRRWWVPAFRPLRLLWQCMAASISVELLAAPLVIYYFHNFPLLFLPANIVASVLMGLVALTGGFLVWAFAGVPVVAKVVAAVVCACIGGFNEAMLWLQQLNPASLQYLHLSLPELLVLYAAIACFLYALLRPKKILIWPGFAASVLLLLLLCRDEWSALHQQRLVVYNTGRQLTAELIRGKSYRSNTLVRPAAVEQWLKGPHAAWKTWRHDRGDTLPELFCLRGKNILLWKEGVSVNRPPGFRVDVLVLERSLRALSPAEVLHLFRPGVIVAGNGQRRKDLLAWSDSCALYRVPFHATPLEGAWVLE